MTAYPSPNPGGQNRRLIRQTVANWISAQEILGLLHVYPSQPTAWNFDAYPHTSTGFGALAVVTIPTDSEDREAYTGSTDRGGKLVHYPVTLRLVHQSYEAADDDLAGQSEDDYDRIYDALKDSIRGIGRDLGRPDVILAAGEWPRQGGITGNHLPPVLVAGGMIAREGTLLFNVSQYLTQWP